MSNIDIEYKLVEQIKDELAFPPSTTGVIVEYLNRHGWIRTPDEAEAAARGEAHRRRIELTESQVEAIGRDAINYFTPGGTWADWARAVFKSADFPVVPDPELTNAERLAEDLMKADRDGGHAYRDGYYGIAQYLIDHGWKKAPGGDDE